MEFILGLLAGLMLGIAIGLVASQPIERLDDKYFDDPPKADRHDGESAPTPMGFDV